MAVEESGPYGAVVFALKGSGTLRAEVHNFFRDHLGFGEFVFRLPDGREVGRAASLHEFEQRLKTVSAASLLYHAKHNHFFNWMMARAEVALASRLHKLRFRDRRGTKDLGEDIVVKVHTLRKLRQRGVVTQFARDGFDPEVTDFVRIGEGSMGGKARGIAFVRTRMQSIGRTSILRRIAVRVPGTCVIATDGFDDFIRLNNLNYVEGRSDEEIARLFEQAAMPAWSPAPAMWPSMPPRKSWIPAAGLLPCPIPPAIYSTARGSIRKSWPLSNS